MKKFLAVFLTGVIVLGLCISSAGCGEEELPASAEIIVGHIAAQKSVESVEMETDTSMNFVMDIQEEEMSMGMPANMNVDMTMSFASDEKNERMRLVLNMDMEVPGEDPMKINAEMYYLDGWMYVIADMPMMEPQWMKVKIPYEDCLEGVGELELTSSHLEILEESHATVTGSEKVDGVDCYVLELTPDMDEIWDIIMQQMLMAGSGMPDVPVVNINEMIDTFSVRYWIAKDTYYLAKSEMDISMEITPEAMGVYDEEGSVSLDMTMNMRMFNYNKELTFELPPEAENAMEQSIW